MIVLTRLSLGLVASSGASTGDLDALAAWVEEHEGVALTVRPARSYKELAASVREGSSDVAWLPPVAYAWLAEAVTPIGTLVRAGEATYAAALVVREGSPIRSLADLSGVRAGWVDPWSAAGYVVPRLELARAKIDPQAAFSSEAFHGSHREALAALGRDECDVVGTYARATREGAPPEGAWTEVPGLDVRVLATFGSIPGDVLAARRNLGPADLEHATRAFGALFRHGRADAVFGESELREGATRGHDALRRAYESGLAKGLFD